MRKAFGYAWCTGANLFYVLVVAYILGRVPERGTTIILSSLGLIYVAMRSAAVMQVLNTQAVNIELAKSLDDIRSALGLERQITDFDTMQTAVSTIRNKLFIEIISFIPVTLICLFFLLENL